MKKGWLVFISLILAIESLLVPPGAAAAGLAFTSVSSQADTSVALDTEGEIYAWGSNWNGQFGNGTSAGSAEPQRIEVLEHGLPVTFREVKTGRSHSLALDTDGQIWSTGDNGYGQLGKGHFDASLSWSKLVITDEGAEVSFSTIAAGWGSSYAIDDNGELWGWGLRISSTMPQRTAIPTKLGLTDGGSPVQFQSIANNNEQAIGIDSSNHLWQIALVGDQTQKFNLTDDGTTPQFQSVAVGAGYGNGGFLALALETDGDLWIWGSNDHGQLGDSGVEDETRWLPEKLTVLDHGSPVLFSKIAGGNHHALALDTNGNLWAWGKNDQGQLGNGSTAGNGPVKVTTEDNGNPTRFTSITAGFEKSYALDAEGRIWAWGYSYGLMPSRFPAGVSPTVTLAVSQTSSTYLEEVTLTANVSGVWGMPTGTVEFRDGTHVLGNRALSGGTAELDLSTLSAGPHHLTVHYSGDVTYSALASEILDYTVDMPGAPALTLTPSTTADTFDPVTIAVDVQIEGTGNTLDSLKWLAGSRAAEDFAGAGTDILGSRSFEAASSGIYTAYARDAAGSETVETIELNNILAAGDAAGLNAAIAAAGQALAEHPEGSGVGEAPAAARSTLQAAIGAAQAVAGEAAQRTQEQLDSARLMLEAATASFRLAVIGAGDAAGLNAAIAAAGQALAEHPEGSGVGEAPAAARSTLQAAIGAAQAVANEAAQRTQEQLDGARLTLEAATASFRLAVIGAGDAAGLNAAIAAAGQALAEHPEGSGVGEAPAAARSTLQAAIGAAQAVAGEAAQRTQEQLDDARLTLEAATASFRLAVIGLVLTAPNEGLYGTGSTLEIILTYREAVTVSGVPYLGITLGSGPDAETVHAVYSGTAGENGTALRFTYEVPAGLSALDGIVLDAQLSLPDGAAILYSGSSESAVTSFAIPDTSRVRIASVLPAIELAAGSGAGTTAEIAVTASAHGSAAGNTLTHLRWLVGSRTVVDFDGGTSGADLLAERTFTVRENRSYTVYAKDAAGNEAVGLITINSIVTPVYPFPVDQPPVKTDDEPGGTEERLYTLQLATGAERLEVEWTAQDLTALLRELDGRALASEPDGVWTLTLPKVTASALNPDSMLHVRTGLGDYLLPAALLQELDDQSYSEVRIALSEGSISERRGLQAAAAALGAEIQGQPLHLKVSAVIAGAERVQAEFDPALTLMMPRPAGPGHNQSFVARYDSVQGSFAYVPTSASSGEQDWTWRARSGGLYVILTYDRQFLDMEGSWAAEAVHQLASRLIVQGVDHENFAPKAPVTRAELTAMVVRALGLSTDAAGQTEFDDVDRGSWYAASLAVAVREGLVQGDAQGGFRPDASISRQEAAALLLRALQWVGPVPAAGSEQALHGFTDSDRIAPWARTILADAVSSGLLQGDPEGRLKPQASISRAEAAVMLVRLLEKTTSF